jgi:AAA domain
MVSSVRRPGNFRDRSGQLHQCVARFDRPPNGVPGEKTIRPFTYCRGPDGSCEWRPKALPENRPLYGLPELANKSTANVVIVEGEKTADAAAKVFPHSVVTTWSGGCNAVNKTDWLPLACRSRVLLIPDKDDPGRKAMLQVASILAGLGITDIKVVDADSLAALTPDGSQKVVPAESGWDLANALEEGWQPEQLRKAAFRHSKPFEAMAVRLAAAPLVELINGAAVTPEPIGWIWPGWFARGKAHILGGAPGTGKTTQAEDVFGLHPLAPAARNDCKGIAWLLDRGHVVAIDAAGADIVTVGRAKQRFYRKVWIEEKVS